MRKQNLENICPENEDSISDNINVVTTYIFRERERGIVSSPDRVSRSDDGAAGLERRHYASLRYGDTLLLHGFVDTRPI